MLNLSNFLIPLWVFSNSVNPPKIHHFIASGRKPARIISTTASTPIDVIAPTTLNLMKSYPTLEDGSKGADVSSFVTESPVEDTAVKSNPNIVTEINKVDEQATSKTSCSTSTTILVTESIGLSSSISPEVIKLSSADSFESTTDNSLNTSPTGNSEKITPYGLIISTKNDLNSSISGDIKENNTDVITVTTSIKKNSGFAYGRSVYFCVDFLEVGTINAMQYCDTLSKLKEEIWIKQPGLLKSGVLLWNDNARPHSATSMQNHIATLGWERLYQSPDLRPCDFLLYPALQKNLV
ncbi:histone-lysine N-methyltransferase SETMAR [Trichonephila clavipes]|nr:histone-lysine N-methyltransferase SETMAR [Trichonephila clavipes]